MQFMSSGFNNIQSEWFNSCANVNSSKYVKNFTKPCNIKYWVACVLIYYNKCKMQFVNNGFNILKVNGSIMIIEEIKKKSLIHSNINVGFEIVTCVLINYGKCKMQPLSNGFNMLKVDSSTHVPC
jgi:hypothetical protein